MSESAFPSVSHARTRPLAELSLDNLIARAPQLAQSWAVALVLARPPDSIGSVPLERLAGEGPFLCAQTLRALQSNLELDRLTGGGAPTGREQSAAARQLASIVGAVDGGYTSEAVEALRGVLWEGLLEELRWPAAGPTAARQLADLSDRLAHVCSCALAAALRAGEPSRPEGEDEATVVVSLPEGLPRQAHGRSSLRPPAVIVDEHDGEGPAVDHSAFLSSGPLESERESTSVPARSPSIRPLSWDESPPVAPGGRGEEIEIRDERGEEGPSAWVGSIGRQLDRYRQDGVPFAVLLLEPVEIDRLRRAPSTEGLQRVAAEIEEALALHWAGSLTRQRPARYWLLAPATNRLSARDLAERLQASLSSALRFQGEPLRVAVGTATCPEDGLEASVLAAHADVGLYAARSALKRGSEPNPRAPASIDESA